MDFPVCPSCGQSVIDDDVADCPFCGSSMSGKPGTKSVKKPAAPAVKPAAAQQAAAKPAGAKPSAPVRASAGKSQPDDDFPFDTEVPGAKTAVQAMPNPSKGRSLKVVCPMCETEGYVPPTAVGKDVKCANAKCMVPIFKAPAPTVEAPPPPAPEKKGNLIVVGGVTMAIMAAIGAAAVFLPGMLDTKPKPPTMSDEDKAMLSESTKTKPITVSATPGTKLEDPKPEGTPAKPAADKLPNELITAAIKQLNDACTMNPPRQRSKAVCRQLAADACIRAGDVKAANEHLSQLAVVGSTYYRVEPSVTMFWHSWAGDKTTAGKVLDAALDDARKLPTRGRNQMEVASQLAAALVVAGRMYVALEQLKEHQSADAEGQLSARVQMASDGRLTRVTKNLAVLPWTRPQAVATTASLVAHDQLTAARSWAEAQPGEDSKLECLAVWAEGLAFKQSKPGPANATPGIDEAIKGLSAAMKARVWARAACGRFAAGDLEGASATLKLATTELASVAIPVEPQMPSIKATVNYKLPADAPLVQAATAAAEIAFAHTLWPDHRKQAEEALDQSLAFARGLAPAWAAVSERNDQLERLGLSGLRDLMKTELALKSDDQANQSANRYRTVLKELVTASQRRFILQANTMSRLIEAGLTDKVWSVVSDRSAETNASRRDDFLGTSLVGELLERLRGTETEKIIQGAVGGASIPRPDAVVVMELLQQNPAQAAEHVSKLAVESGQRDDIALTLATSLAASGNVELTFAFISKIEDIVLKEEAYRLSGALLAQRGHADAVWKQIAALQQATEKASLSRGLIMGLKAGPPVKEVPSQ